MAFKDMMRGMKQRCRCLLIFQCCFTVNDEFEQKIGSASNEESEEASNADGANTPPLLKADQITEYLKK
jgi:hypothetical protein